MLNFKDLEYQYISSRLVYFVGRNRNGFGHQSRSRLDGIDLMFFPMFGFKILFAPGQLLTTGKFATA